MKRRLWRERWSNGASTRYGWALQPKRHSCGGGQVWNYFSKEERFVNTFYVTVSWGRVHYWMIVLYHSQKNDVSIALNYKNLILKSVNNSRSRNCVPSSWKSTVLYRKYKYKYAFDFPPSSGPATFREQSRMADNRGWRIIEWGGESSATELRKSVPMVLMADSQSWQ